MGEDVRDEDKDEVMIGNVRVKFRTGHVEQQKDM